LLAVVIVLGLGALFLLFVLLPLKGYQAIHVRHYKSCYPTFTFQTDLSLAQELFKDFFANRFTINRKIASGKD